MPPKIAKPNAPSKKTEAKKKDKIIEDKTFGLKNKKGAKQQKFVAQVSKQVKDGGNKTFKDAEKEREKLLKTKEEKKKALAEINSLFKPIQQVLAAGVDPKSVLCAFFKEGQCTKGTKCKFSHDLNIERKGEKRNMYEDDEQESQKDDYAHLTLAELIEKKHGAEANRPNPTTIICRDFLNAVESGKYGWFWNCPSANKCKYRHALPAGYILKKDKKRLDKDKEVISIEDLVERERAALGDTTTKVTLVTFLAWKKKKLKEKAFQEKKEEKQKQRDYKSGKTISGKDLFTFNPEMDGIGNTEFIEEGDAEFDFRNMARDPDDPDEEDKFQFKEIDMDDLMSEYREVDTDPRVSVADTYRFGVMRDEIRLPATPSENKENGLADSDDGGAVAIDEALFDDLDDLDDLEDELEELELES